MWVYLFARQLFTCCNNVCFQILVCFEVLWSPDQRKASFCCLLWMEMKIPGLQRHRCTSHKHELCIMVMLNSCLRLYARQGSWLIFWLQVYDLSTGSRLRSLTGTYFSPFEIHTPTHQVYLVFDTDGSVTRRGWNLTYTACEFIVAGEKLLVIFFQTVLY